MKPHKLICFLTAAALIICFGGCNGTDSDSKNNPTSVQTETGEDIMESNKQLLTDKLGITEARAEGAAEIIAEVGIGALNGAEWISGKQGSRAEVTDKNGEKYLLCFGGLGFLETIIRESDNAYIYYQVD